MAEAVCINCQKQQQQTDVPVNAKLQVKILPSVKQIKSMAPNLKFLVTFYSPLYTITFEIQRVQQNTIMCL